MSDDLPPNDGDDVNETPDQSIEDILGPDPDATDDDGDEGNPDAGAVVVPADIGQHDRVEPIDLNTEMQRSYIEYAMSVIVSRALPDVRDGLKPVHRRIVYAMYDGGYRPDRGYNKCARVVGDVMGHYHPHGDSAIYDALVRLVQDWSLRYPLVDGQGNFGSRGNDGAAAPRYTECRMASIAMEMVRDIEQDTVDFVPNYDGKTLQPLGAAEPLPQPARQRLRRHRRRHGDPDPGAQPARGRGRRRSTTSTTRTSRARTSSRRCSAIIKGPDFPTGALIMGHKGIEEAYRTGRGSIIMRAVVEVEEIQNRQCLVVTELPYQVNPDMLALKIADLVKDGKISGIADIRDETSGRTGQRLVIVLKRDAVAKVVLNNLYKHTQLQTTFGANMLALVDEVPRTLPLDGFIRHWVDHQVEVIVRRTTFRLRKAEADIHILRGLLKALDRLDEVIALIRGSRTVEIAREGLIELLEIDEIQANAILNMQLRRLAALEREKLIEAHDELQALIDEYTAILASPVRQREIISEELADIVERYGDERRTTIVPFDGDMSMEDLIPEEDVVVTITRGGYAKRTRVDQYRSQKRGGKGVRGARCAARTSSSTSSRRRPTTGCSSSPTSAGSTAPRPTSCPRARATARASTWPTCSPSSPASRSPRCSPSATTRRPTTSSSPPARASSRRRAWPTTTPTAPAASSRSTCARATSSSAPAWPPTATTCCSSRARASRCASPRPTRRCARWVARPPVSRA